MAEERSELPARHSIAAPDASTQETPDDSAQAAWASGPSVRSLDGSRAEAPGSPAGLPGAAAAPRPPLERRFDARSENSELERRFLALERVLQALVAHMAEAEPKFLTRLTETFCVRMQMTRPEHDYTDTDTYAAEFVRSVVRLADKAAKKPQAAAKGRRLDSAASSSGPGEALPLFALPCIQVRQAGGVWHVTKDGKFYGDFVKEAEALQAVEAAGGAVVRIP